VLEAISMADSGNKTWSAEQAQGYLDYADLLVIERQRIVHILESLFAYHFQGKTGLTLLDLGCGDGFITQVLQSKYPDHIFNLMDGSSFMLEKARQRLNASSQNFLVKTFADFIDEESGGEKYDFIYSSNAIHHLDLADKRRLYSKVFHELKPEGLFINADPVLPVSEKSEQWQFRLWIDWIRETANKRNLDVAAEMIENVPSGYKKKEENKPSSLIDQLQILKEVGFNDVDCFYKYSIFAVFGGTK
jgi:tRNA (cmo5U34)-methyltransferase